MIVIAITRELVGRMLARLRLPLSELPWARALKPVALGRAAGSFLPAARCYEPELGAASPEGPERSGGGAQRLDVDPSGGYSGLADKLNRTDTEPTRGFSQRRRRLRYPDNPEVTFPLNQNRGTRST